MKILVLGHKGMLGNMVNSYFKEKNDVITTDLRWPTNEFKNYISDVDVDFIINCIGAIPQKHYNTEDYENLNVNLPLFLNSTNKRLIHPSTDCEFSGELPYPKKYDKNCVRDAKDDYGKSKAKISEILEKKDNVRMIRTSIIGYELHTSYSLLEWFLNNTSSAVNGFSNYYWNGITSLFWCEIVEKILHNWYNYPTLTDIGSETISKYELLKLFNKVYNKNIVINQYKLSNNINRVIKSDFLIPSIEEQLYKLKIWKIHNINNFI